MPKSNPNSSLVIVDIDGTLADSTHREYLLPDWTAFCEDNLVLADAPLPLVQAVRTLAETGYEIVFFTGREEKTRWATWQWLLSQFNFIYDWQGNGEGVLFMRENEDRRKDEYVKCSMFNSHPLRKQIVLAIDDNEDCAKMYSEQCGLTVWKPRKDSIIMTSADRTYITVIAWDKFEHFLEKGLPNGLHAR